MRRRTSSITRRLITVAVLALSGQVSAKAPGPSSEARTALVFLIAGQSNAGGVAAFSPESNERAGMATKHPTIPGSTAEEVGIPTGAAAYPRSYIWGRGFERLTPGKNLKGGYRDPYRHGIELPIAMLLEQKYPEADKFFIKHGPGGHNLHTQWKAGMGPDYRNFKSQFDGAMADLRKRYQRVRIVGLYWDQGESDRPKAQEYGKNLRDLFTAFRRDTGIPTLPIFVRKHLFQHGDESFAPIIDAQVTVTKTDPNSLLLDLDLGTNARNFKAWAWTDNNGHLSSKAYLKLATHIVESVGTLTLRAQCPDVFGDHGVFQQGISVPIWGTTLPKAKVKVTFSEQRKSTVSDNTGRWRVTLDPMGADKLASLHKAPAGRTLTIATELEGEMASRAFQGILVGEVWLCAGQSNMAGKVRHNHAKQDPKDNLLKSNLPAIRHLSAPGGWQSAVPGAVGEFTRVGFCFARKVQRELKVPIGLINACRGGSRIESWMREARKDLSGGAAVPNVAYGELYRERIVPLVGYGMRGALWYQGEANAIEGHSYFLKMETMIGDWRSRWKLGDFPFYFVQLAGIGTSPTDSPAMGDGRARIREAQRRALAIKNTGMAVAVDIGAKGEHPPNKVEVGERLAHWALHRDYGRHEILPSGPLYKGSKIEGSTIRITFDHGQGLMLASKSDYTPPVPAPHAKIRWLSIQAKDGAWHWAEGRINGNDLIVSNKLVKEPVGVRYAYTNRPLGPSLYNKAGLPASPFSTSGKLDEAED